MGRCATLDAHTNPGRLCTWPFTPRCQAVKTGQPQALAREREREGLEAKARQWQVVDN